MESGSRKSGLRVYSQGITNEVTQRLRDRVPFEDAGNPTSVVGVLHRLTTVDFVTHTRFKGVAKSVMLLSKGQLNFCGALELVAHTLGYASYKSAWKAKTNGRFINAIKARRQERKEAEVASA